MRRYLILNPRRGKADRWVSFKINSVRLMIPLVFAAIVTIIWCQFARRGLDFGKDTEVMVGSAAVVLGAVLAVAAGLMLNEIWQRSHAFSAHILMKDQEKFMLLRDERPPFAISATLIASGFGVLILLGGAHYPTPASGGFVVFFTAFAMAMYVVVIKELQDPAASQWFATRIPRDWLEADVDEFFEKQAAARNNPPPAPPAPTKPTA